jgi:hypothetical protein
MTCIAFRDGIMAADSLGNDDGIGKCRLQKLHRKRVKGKEHLIGVCGFFEAAMLFVDWYGGSDTAMFDRLSRLSTDDDFGVLIWTGKKLFNCNRLMRLTEVEEDFYAIGSGAGYAMTAMECGKSARQAVQMAARRDISTGGRIVQASLTA